MNDIDTAPTEALVHVEDDADFHEIFADFLSEHKPQLLVTGLSSHDELAKWINEHEPRPTTFVVDLRLENVASGIDCIGMLRNSKWSSHATIVVLTASESPADIKAVQAAGANFYFSKRDFRGEKRSIYTEPSGSY